MIRKDKHKFADGSYKTQIRVTEGYRDSVTGKSKQKTIRSFGYLEDQDDQNSFMKMVIDFDNEHKKDKRIVLNEIKSKPFYEDDSSTLYNFGYKYIEAIYNYLELDTFFNSIEYKGNSSLNEMFKFLVIQRILNPDSKRANYQMVNSLYGKKYSFSLYELYRSLDLFAENSDNLQKYLNDVIKMKIGRNTAECFYDSTNYYFQKDYEDEDEYEELDKLIASKTEIKKLKIVELTDEKGVKHQFKPISGLLKRGVSKEHVVDPIVQLGLMMDSNGIPISAKIFPGNTSDSKTLIPILDNVKKNYGLDRTVIVADKGMNCNENIDIICNNGDGYMFSQILKGKKGRRYQERLFNESLYTIVNDDYKYQLFEEDYDSLDKDGNKITRKRKVLIYYNGAAARRDKKKREEKLRKAENSLKNNAYELKHGYEKYIKKIAQVDSTGEVIENFEATINYEKVKDDELYDGYFAIITSELNFDEKKIREVYHGLWRIEESFRVTKSDLVTRPVFVRTENHIKGHVLICFIALVLLRVLQHKMDYSLSVERIVRALHMCSCSEISKGIIHVIKKDTYDMYLSKKYNDKECLTLNTSDELSETIEDYKLIIKYYESSLCKSLMNKQAFDKCIKNIRFRES